MPTRAEVVVDLDIRGVGWALLRRVATTDPKPRTEGDPDMAEHFDLEDLPAEVRAFLTERHLATLTTISPSGDLQVTPVGFTYQPERNMARVITWATSVKAKNVAAHPGGKVAVSQVDGGRWLTLYGAAELGTSAESCAEGVSRYAERYRQPKERDDRVVIEILVDRIIGRA